MPLVDDLDITHNRNFNPDKPSSVHNSDMYLITII